MTPSLLTTNRSCCLRGRDAAVGAVPWRRLRMRPLFTGTFFLGEFFFLFFGKAGTP